MIKRSLIASFGIILLISMLLFSGCSSSPKKPDDVDKITQNLLQAVLDGDFETYRGYFAENLQPQLGTPDDFSEVRSELQTIFGDYIEASLNYSGFEATEDGQLKVHYKARFTKVNDVEILLVCRESKSETVVEGFWINR